MYALYNGDFLTDFVYYDLEYNDELLIGYYIDSLDVLEMGYSVDLVKKEEINNEIEVYSDRELINLIYQYNLKSIEDEIKNDKDLFSIYAKTAINNPKISDYLPKVLLMFKAVSINKGHLDLWYFINRLKDLEIIKSDNLSVDNAAGVYRQTSNDIRLKEDDDRVIFHELMHFIDYSINNDMNNKIYECDDKLAVINDLKSYYYVNDVKECNIINDFNRFITETGAEYYTALYYDNYSVTAYHNVVSIYSLLNKIYGNDIMRDVYVAEDGYYQLYNLLMGSGLSLYDAKDFLVKTSYITNFNADYLGQYYIDVCDYLVRIIKKTGINWYDDKSYVYNNAKERRTLTGITWICKSQDGDSLVCFSDGKKRGYFNRYTGEVVIPAQYDHAWIFSDGVAGVVMDNELSFIGHDGQAIFERPVYYNAQASMDYCFYEGLCAVMADEQHVGLINKKGEWVVEPIYTSLNHSHKHFWVAKRDDNTYGMFNREGRRFLPFEYADITISDESEYIHVRTFAHMDQILDLNGHLQNPCDYYGVNKLTYSTDELDSVGDFRTAVANCLQYNTSDGHYGLMDKLGNAITPPLYTSINAIAANRYQCEAAYGSVIIDDAGKECGVKP